MARNNVDAVTIAVMGATGAGKSTFINLVSGSKLRVGYGLESCTSDVQVGQPFMLDGKMITLVDTPGFDDTVKTEAEILRLISDFLATSYEQGRTLNGVIFLHRISDYRMGGVARKNFRLFRKLCGDDALNHVVVATNMWGDVALDIGERRESELSQSDLFFKPALDKGAQLLRHSNTLESAHTIIRSIIGFAPEPLLIQRETVDQGKALAQTGAGQDLQAELDRQAAKYRGEMDALKGEMEELVKAKDAQHGEEMREMRDALAELRGQLEKVEGEKEKIRAEHEHSGREQEERIKEMLAAVKAHEDEVRCLQEQTVHQGLRMKELEEAVEEVGKRAAEEQSHRAKVEEDLKKTNAVYQAEMERMRKDFERKLEQARYEAAQRSKPTPTPATQESHWATIYRATRERRGVLGAWGIVLDHFFNPPSWQRA